MRTLKFRFWDEKYNTWVNDPLFVYPSTEFVKQGIVIQQFTGLKDKNGKEIYEGDIVKTKYNTIGIVEFNNHICSFRIAGNDGINSGLVVFQTQEGSSTQTLVPVAEEVIGNIFEK